MQNHLLNYKRKRIDGYVSNNLLSYLESSWRKPISIILQNEINL